MKLSDKNIFITGGTSGLGFETAKLLANKGANVIVCSANKTTIEEAIKGTALQGIICDVTNPDDIKNIQPQLSNIDILINNAGIWLEGNLGDTNFEEISKMIDVNIKGTLFMTKAVLPFLKKKNSGVILNVSSTSGIKAKPLQSAYIASKFAIKGFTEGLKEDLIDTDINVIGFYPGGMKTQFFAKAKSAIDTSNFMNPVDIARTIVFILENSDKMILEQTVITRPKPQ